MQPDYRFTQPALATLGEALAALSSSKRKQLRLRSGLMLAASGAAKKAAAAAAAAGEAAKHADSAGSGDSSSGSEGEEEPQLQQSWEPPQHGQHAERQGRQGKQHSRVPGMAPELVSPACSNDDSEDPVCLDTCDDDLASLA